MGLSIARNCTRVAGLWMPEDASVRQTYEECLRRWWGRKQEQQAATRDGVTPKALQFRERNQHMHRRLLILSVHRDSRALVKRRIEKNYKWTVL